MNCKPNDLAIIISAPEEASDHIGKIVRCMESFKIGDLDFWKIEKPLPNKNGIFDYWGVADHRLKPLRGLGDDAVDQTLLIIPAPSKTKEMA